MGAKGKGGVVVLLGLALAGCNGGKLTGADGMPRATPTPLKFGVVAVGAEGQAELELANDGNAPLKVVAISPVNASATGFGMPGGGQTIPAGNKVKLSFRFQPSDTKNYDTQVRIRTDSRRQPSVTVDLQGRGERPTVACSTRLDFGRVVLNLDHYANIVCVNSTDVPATLQIDAVTGPDAALFTVGTNLNGPSTTLGAHSSGTIEARYQARYLGPANADARIEVLGSGAQPLDIPMTGEAFTSDFWIEPSTLDFGAINPGHTRTLQLELVNNGTTEVIVTELDLTDPDGVFATPATGALEIHVPGATRQPLDVSFTPKALSDYRGSLMATTTDPVNHRIEVSLRGKGGGPKIVVVPDHVDFGMVASQMTVTAHVLITNAGTDAPLNITAADITGDPADFAVAGFSAGISLLPGVGALDLTVTFHPPSAGDFQAALHLSSDDLDNPELDVPLTGQARDLPPCTWLASPPAIVFGTVGQGSLATQSTRITNAGADDCVFSSVQLSAGSSGAFALAGGPIPLVTLAAGASMTLAVDFDTTQAGPHTGSIEFGVSNPAQPQGTIPITGTAADGCLAAYPSAVDFGDRRLVCPPEEIDVKLVNSCSGPAQLTSITLRSNTGKLGEITLGAAALTTLSPGASLMLKVHYQPVDEGLDTAAIDVTSPVLTGALSIPISGAGTADATRTDRFTQKSKDAVDVLWVVDNSGSMTDKQQAIADGFDSFIQYAVTSGIDYHIGVTTTGLTRSGGTSNCPGGVEGGEEGRLFPADGSRPRWVAPTTPDAVNVFKQNVKVGTCHWLEQGLEAAYLALSPPLVDHADDPEPTSPTHVDLPDDGNLGFYRADARLSVIVVSDANDQSNRTTAFYSTFFQNLKGPARAGYVTVHAVDGDSCPTAEGPGDRYDEVVRATGGVSLQVCAPDWSKLIDTLAAETFGFQRRFSLTGTPAGAVTVTVNGAAAIGWTYDPLSNTVEFDSNHVPVPGSLIEITYTPTCST